MENKRNEIFEKIRNKERIWELMAREHERKIQSLWIYSLCCGIFSRIMNEVLFLDH